MNGYVDPAFKDKLEVAELSWEDTDQCTKYSSDVDIIIGADITYDPTIIPVLVTALKAMIQSSQQVAYIMSTVRNPETFELFLRLIDETGVLSKSVMDLTEAKMTALCLPNPMTDFRLVLITRK
ncbi:hypothetical protein GGI07_003988 [Coemansia sp. Benny D115]|nr:hypothetical protein GGI07_003988 [Coemansia sp. Benny D115]